MSAWTIDRRHFLGIVGGSCAVTTAAGLTRCTPAPRAGPPGGPPEARSTKRPATPLPEAKLQTVTADVLVVGGGMAGVFAAVKAHDKGAQVVVVDKGSVGKSGQTPFARGFFSYEEEAAGMSKQEFLADVALASEGLNNPAYTRLLLDDSAARCGELRSWGFFDTVACAGSLRRPLEERKIPLHERCTLTHLLYEEGRVAGAMGFFIDTNVTLVVRATSVVLCTGASGFKPAGWQIGGLTSDGDAMAYRIGAEITGKEWCDGHPMTNFGLEGRAHVVGQPRISPMLGVELNVEVSKNGVPESMPRPPPPRDRTDRAEGPDLHEAGRGPGGDRHGPPPGGRGHGPPPGPMMGGASAGMAIHKSEGLFPADARGASNVPGLYGAGDALGSMQSGGIYAQVGSSLAGSAVQGAVAGEAAAEFARGRRRVAVPRATIARLDAELRAPLDRPQGFSPAWVTHTLQGVMIPNFILFVKEEARLEAALTYIEYLRDHQVPKLVARDLHDLRLCHETRNMVLNAEMKLRASLARTESRGSHYREDFPRRDDPNWRRWIKLRRGDGGTMELSTVAAA